MSGIRKAGLIVNPGSHGNKAGIADIIGLIEQHPQVVLAVLNDMADLARILRDFANDGVDTIVVAGGDGTVQGVLNCLFDEEIYETSPLLVLLPRGRTNMTAADIGVRGRGVRGLKKVLKVLETGDIGRFVVERHILCVENAKNMAPQYGMFFGGAGIWRAIEFTRTKIHPLDMGADTTSAMTFLRLFWRWLVGRGRGNGSGDELFRGDDISVTIDGADRGTISSFIVLATTLDKLLIGTRPFWNVGDGLFAFTQIAYPPIKPFRYARRVLFGGPKRNLPAQGYFSSGAREVRLGMTCPFTLDGAFLEPENGRQIILTAEKKASFRRI
jgi:hypothetical protein